MNNNRFNELIAWQILQLAKHGGFSHKYIAALVLGKKFDNITKYEKGKIARTCYKDGVLITNYRNGLTSSSQLYAKSLLKNKPKSNKSQNKRNNKSKVATKKVA